MVDFVLLVVCVLKTLYQTLVEVEVGAKLDVLLYMKNSSLTQIFF